MPKPRPGESRNDFVGRCIPMLMDEGKTQEQAVGACEGMYSTYRKNIDIMDALKFMKLMDMGAREYATQQAWDMGKAANVLAYIAELLIGEIGEPTDISKLTNIMREIMQFIESEMQEFELSSRDIAGKSVDELLPDEPADQPEPEIEGDGMKKDGPNSDYLVVDEEGQHLRVKRNGTPDHRLMGAAWAALHGGYRGNKYQGSGKEGAIAKLKRLYKAEGMNTPSEKSLDLSYAKSLGLNVSEKDLAVKYVSKDTIRHPVFLWGNPDLLDLEGEYFTKETDFWDEVLGKSKRPLTWDHATDSEFMSDPLIGETVEWEDDDIGRWAISVLKKGHKYRNAIDMLISGKSLGSAAIAAPIIGASSDSAPQYVKRVKVGNAVWLERWPWFATALTPSPCEPRMIGADGKGVEFLKSLGIALPDTPNMDVESEKAILDYFKVKYQLGD